MTTPANILLLGGTGEARALARELDEAGIRVISSLAGRVARPRLPVGEVRIGGFGGPEALSRWLAEHGIAAVVDATHPFAERISASAAAACAAAEVPLLRLERPGWTAQDGDDWHWVDDLEEAAAAVPALGSRVLLTSGRQGLAAFAGDASSWYLIRCVDPPDAELPARHEIRLDRGPYTVEGELSLIDEHRIDLLVTKDSGGSLTEAKLSAARLRGMPVVVIRRPPRAETPTVTTVAAASGWVQSGYRRGV
ncbi:MAG: Precorrin-6A reductase [uncultured Solirubrobacteraceae bacterium]|uniref:Precorrin-6A reductase n=1 Tax=uncultured Solirubrobacteraceae bacterium TaxID=1162706 RepID=A0A6J4SZT9_9ACTN|nr:MAG: Precorrin-6A reductase [uncultured Solirubrobacteraceae bacterium]